MAWRRTRIAALGSDITGWGDGWQSMWGDWNVPKVLSFRLHENLCQHADKALQRGLQAGHVGLASATLRRRGESTICGRTVEPAR